MNRRTLVAAGAALILCACGPRQFILFPAPPVEVRREPPGPAVPPPSPRAVPAPPAADNAAGLPAPPSHDPARYALAIARTREAISRGTPADAVRFWKTLEGGPWNADAVFNQGVLLQIGGDLEGAGRQYRALTDNVPVHEGAAANLLGLYQIRGDAASARALAGRVVADGSSPSAAILPQLRTNLAGWYLESGELDRAATVLSTLRGQGAETPTVAWNAAILSYRRGDLEGARRSAALIPREMESLWPVAASRYAWERDARQIPRLDNVPDSEPMMAALSRNLAAYAALSQGDAAAAERILARHAERADCPAELLTNLGAARVELGKWKEAREALEKAVRKKPALAEGWLNLGIFREIYEGDAAGAVECYRNYVKYNGLRKAEVAKWIEWVESSSPRP